MRTAVLLALLMMASPAFANHPGDRLDEVMAEKEPAFEPTGHRRPPAAGLVRTDGGTLDLRDLTDRIVVLSFATDGCGDPCADQQALLAEVQEAVNVTPMREIVTFVTVARAGAVPASGEAANWLAAEPTAGETADTLAAAFARISSRGGVAPMVHVIDRGGRSAGIFHGAGFGRVNMVLYINGLTNAHPPEPGLLDRILGVFQ
jgi:protein SCO1/2